jgi:exoribonuclease-2
VEGKVVHGEKGVDVGDRVRVQLLETDAEQGFIDFGVVAAAPLSKSGAL